jgi:predicted Zn-dependent peptidase
LVHLLLQTPVAHAGIFIAIGSRHETEQEQGLAHFIEHTLFKGTNKRTSREILTRLESVGGELNAYTSREETVVYASFLSKHSKRALEMLSDIVFNSTFPEKELEKEKEVVIDEIDSYLDTPSEQIFDDFEEHLFPNQPFGANILGTPEKVKSFTQKQILHFIASHYHPENMVVSYAGSMSFENVKKQIERCFPLNVNISSFATVPAKASEKFTLHVKKPVHQLHCIMGNIAPSIHSADRTAMTLLNNYLGGPAMSSVLNMALREKNGLTYNNESHYEAYSDTGIFLIYIGTEKRNIKKCLNIIHKELKNICSKPLSRSVLSQIKQQYCGQIAVASDSGLNQMISIGKDLLHTGKVMQIDDLFNKINEVSAEDILKVACQYLDIDCLNTLLYLPK